MELIRKLETRSSPQQILFQPVFPEVVSSSAQQRENGESKQVSFDLYRSAKPLVVIGRLFLIIPCGLTNSNTYKKPTLGWDKLPLLLSILLSCWTLVELCISTKVLLISVNSNNNDLGMYLGISYFLVHSASTSFTWIYFLLRSDRFYDLFEKWSATCSQYKLTQNSLVRVTWLLLGLMVPALVVQTLFNVNGIINRRIWRNASALEAYYRTFMFGWTDLSPFYPGFVVFHWLLNNLLRFSILFAASVIVFFSRAASSQFRTLIETTIGSKVDHNHLHSVNLANRDKRFWEDLVNKYHGIIYLVTTVNQFLSPLLFSCVTCTVYMVCTQMLEVVIGSKITLFTKQTFGAALLLSLTWLFVILLSVAQVQSDAIRILDVLKHCPMEYYESSGVARLESRVCSGPHIGFTGLSFYIITKRFMVKVVAAIFTIEIVLLQAAESARSNSQPPKSAN